jgi:hypothetical protein
MLQGNRSLGRLLNQLRCLLLLLALLAVAPGLEASPIDCPSSLVGRWDYRFAKQDQFNAEGEQLELSCNRNTLRGIYAGLELELEVRYILVEVTDLTVTRSGEISFVVPERDIYAERPQSLDDIKHKRVHWAGSSTIVREFRGRLEHNGRLVLTCSPDYSCAETTMVFTRSE